MSYMSQEIVQEIMMFYVIFSAGGPMVLWSEHSRGIRPGIGIGKDPKSQVLFLPSNFERIEHYDVACDLDKIEVSVSTYY